MTNEKTYAYLTTNLFASPIIQKVECERFTKSSVYIDGKRVPKVGLTIQYHETALEASESLKAKVDYFLREANSLKEEVYRKIEDCGLIERNTSYLAELIKKNLGKPS